MGSRPKVVTFLQTIKRRRIMTKKELKDVENAYFTMRESLTPEQKDALFLKRFEKFIHNDYAYLIDNFALACMQFRVTRIGKVVS